MRHVVDRDCEPDSFAKPSRLVTCHMENQKISVDILIVGAGLSGLALAYFLQKSAFPGSLLVLDREKVFESARQGFSLTLQNKTRSILQEYNLLKEMYQYGSEARTQKFYTSQGDTLYLHEEQNQKRFNYPLPRQSIRKV
jgi:2-polyprenyl-6-methoxyphenol hydroxylase-like FAD-dependent oxidoreductase